PRPWCPRWTSTPASSPRTRPAGSATPCPTTSRAPSPRPPRRPRARRTEATMRIDVLTLFPEYLAPLELSLIGRARREGRIDLQVHDLRDWTHDRHRTVDDTPLGGGAGMVMKPEPWAEAFADVRAAGQEALGGDVEPLVVFPNPAGTPFAQTTAQEWSHCEWIIFAC